MPEESPSEDDASVTSEDEVQSSALALDSYCVESGQNSHCVLPAYHLKITSMVWRQCAQHRCLVRNMMIAGGIPATLVALIPLSRLQQARDDEHGILQARHSAWLFHHCTCEGASLRLPSLNAGHG